MSRFPPVVKIRQLGGSSTRGLVIFFFIIIIIIIFFYYHYRDGFPPILINWWWSFLSSLLLCCCIRSRLRDYNLPSYHHYCVVISFNIPSFQLELWRLFSIFPFQVREGEGVVLVCEVTFNIAFCFRTNIFWIDFFFKTVVLIQGNG